MTGASRDFRDLLDLRPAALEACLRRGETPDPDALAGREYRGANTARWMRAAGMQTFLKGFERQPDGRLLGYNVRVRQDGLDGTWTPRSDPAAPRRFAFFVVRPVDPTSRDRRYRQALLLDYGAAGGSRLDPVTRIRDYLVRVRPGSDDLLVGRAFVALAGLRPSVTCFVLERLGPARPAG